MDEGNMSSPENIYTLFQSELIVYSNAILEALLKVLKTGMDSDVYKSLYDLSAKINASARIINLPSLESLMEALKKLFSFIKENKVTLQSNQLTILMLIIQDLIEIGKSTNLVQGLEEKDFILKNACKIVEGILSDEAEEKSREITLPEPSDLRDIKKIQEMNQADATMMNLFIIELETQLKALNEGLLELENEPSNKLSLEKLMRSAHSIKGAARVVSVVSVVKLAHSMEDFFVAAQRNIIDISPESIDIVLKAVDVLVKLTKVDLDNIGKWLESNEVILESSVHDLQELSQDVYPKKISLEGPVEQTKKEVEPKSEEPVKNDSVLEGHQEERTVLSKMPYLEASKKQAERDRILRVSAESLNRLMGLAGESLVESSGLKPFLDELILIRKNQYVITDNFEKLKELLIPYELSENLLNLVKTLDIENNKMSQIFARRIVRLESIVRSHITLSEKLYAEVINSRMRPFSDATEGFPRMVRDLARQLGKKAKLEIIGKSTPVDREILEKLETPLNHLLQNAIDHGIETPEQRISAGKPEEGVIRLEAIHRAGMLELTVSDDGRGLDVEKIRQRIVSAKLATQTVTNYLRDEEILEYIYLPGFSTSKAVTEISGRGVGLNIVQNMVHEVSGAIRIKFIKGMGTTFTLQLPLTLSVIRTLLVQIAGEPYAFPLSRIDHALLIPRNELLSIENRHYFMHQGKNVGLVAAEDILELEGTDHPNTELSVIVISDGKSSYGINVDKFIDEKELVVQQLDSQLGKIQDITSGALMADGSPVLIVDVEDMIRTIDNLLLGGWIGKIKHLEPTIRAKKILVIDDSVTVREVQSRLLQNHGYSVELAVNGIDGLNALRSGKYDLVITDIDMPRMNGIDLIKVMKKDAILQAIPVLIVSYKDSDEERLLGLQAGASFYLTKGAFHEESLLTAVEDLIGK